MGRGHKRSDLRANAQAKLDDALYLLQGGRFCNAYYLAGYAAEMGLKACIAIQVVAETIPDKSFVNNIFNHKFKSLMVLPAYLSNWQNNRITTPFLLQIGHLFPNGDQKVVMRP
jgi:hypothetical protein